MKRITELIGSQPGPFQVVAVGFVDDDAIGHLHDAALDTLQLVARAGQLDKQKEIWDMVYSYIDFVKANGYFDYRRNEQSKYWMYETINEHLRDSFYHNPRIETMLADKEAQVLQGGLTSFVAAKELLDTYFGELREKENNGNL